MTQQELFDANTDLVDMLVSMRCSKMPTWAADRDAYRQAGLVALWRCAGRFRSDAGASFRTFAANRVRGAIVDEMREQRPGSRKYPAKQPDSLDEMRTREDTSNLEGATCDPFAAVELRTEMREAMQLLTRQEREVVELTFFGGVTLAEVGAGWGVTESRACQVRRSALEKIRRHLDA